MKSKLLHQHGGQRTFAVVFDPGDEAMAGLERFARDNKLSAAQVTAIGAFSDATVGYFRVEEKEYKKIPVREQVEVLSLVGDISLGPDGSPKVHAHVVLGREDGSTVGGHLIDGRVRPTLEVILVESPEHLRRRFDEGLGFAVIQL
jgi:predicted DNA-binding protein with PD1-like motif